MCILSAYWITLNGHNYEVEVSGVCLFVRLCAGNFSKIPPYTHTVSKCTMNVPLGRGCQRSVVCIFLEQFEIEDGTMTSDWLKHFHLLLLNNCRCSHQTCQICFFVLCVTSTIFQNMVLIFYMPIPFHFQLKIKYYTPSQGKRPIFYILAWKFEWINTSLIFCHHLCY